MGKRSMRSENIRLHHKCSSDRSLRGEAMLVPLNILVAVLDVYQADSMLPPGAKMSTQFPWLLNDDSSSVLSVEPTVIAVDSDAGE